MNAIGKPGDHKTAEVDLGPLAELIGYALRRAQLAVFQDFNRANEAEIIRPVQYSVLKVLHCSCCCDS